MFCDVLGAVGGAIVDDDNLPVELAAEVLAGGYEEGKVGSILLGEALFNEPDNDGEVLALVVGREDDGVLGLRWSGHCRGG